MPYAGSIGCLITHLNKYSKVPAQQSSACRTEYPGPLRCKCDNGSGLRSKHVPKLASQPSTQAPANPAGVAICIGDTSDVLWFANSPSHEKQSETLMITGFSAFIPYVTEYLCGSVHGSRVVPIFDVSASSGVVVAVIS